MLIARFDNSDKELEAMKWIRKFFNNCSTNKLSIKRTTTAQEEIKALNEDQLWLANKK